MKKEIVRFENVTRQEEGATYLDNFSFYICEGEILGLVSVNDRGKSELLKLLARNLPIDFGRIYFEGQLVNSYLNSDYSDNKVYTIDQKSSLIQDLSIADNIFVMRPGFRKYVINEAVLMEQALRVFKELSFDINLNQRVSRLSTMERIIVEAAKAYLMGCRLLILLSPEKIISQADYEKFHQFLLKLKKLNVASLYICYHHWIMFEVCDRIALFSSGRIKRIFEKQDFNQDSFAPYVLSFEGYKAYRCQVAGEPVFQLDSLSCTAIRHLNLSAGPGECITLLDSDNQVTDELLHILTGVETDYEGRIFCQRRDIRKQKGDCLDRGMIILDDNPTETFLFQEMSYLENLSFLLDRKLKRSVLKSAFIHSVRNEYYQEAGDLVDERHIGGMTLREKYGLVYNKISLFHPKILIIKKPFAYGDMRCRNYILERLKALKESGISILLLTNYITDCLYLSDRIEVIKNGQNIVSLHPEEYGIISRIF